MTESVSSGHPPVPGAPAELPQVLLVDDDRDSLEDCAELFGLMGVPVRTAHDPHTAVAIALGDPAISVMVVDVKMAGMDGLSVIAHLRDVLPPPRQMRFIMLTGYDAETMGGELPGVPVFTKPANFEQLVGQVKEFLQGGPIGTGV